MTVRAFVVGSSVTALLSVGVLVLIVSWIDPTHAGRGLAFVLFFLTLFLAVSSLAALAGYAFRSMFVRKQLSAYRVRPALRQGLFLGAFIDLLFFLQLERILVWWVSAIIVLLFIVIELVFISYDQTEQQLEALEKKAREDLVLCIDEHALETWRVEYIGRSGKVPALLRSVKDLSVEEKRVVGKRANELRRSLEEQYQTKLHALSGDKVIKKEHTTYNLEHTTGHVHPLTITLNRIHEIFAAMGFIIADGPEVEEARYNFDALNIPPDHPARGAGDTFMIDPLSVSGEEGIVLRTQTSPMQIRSVETMKLRPPFQVIAPGRVFRREKVDATHESTFYQFEGLGISENTNIADFKGIIATFFSAFFQKDVTVRLRPSYFPFVEPGFEVDMSCVFCRTENALSEPGESKGVGCRVCKYTGWIEVMGAGMVHPRVLENMNIDPKKYQGYAFGGAVDRLTMIRHGITDIRMFWSGDIRFLRQFDVVSSKL